MIEELRRRVQALERPPGFDTDPGVVSLGMEAVDIVLGGGLARGALHEIAAPGEAHMPNASGFAAAVAGLTSFPSPRLRGRGEARSGTGNHIVWIAEDMSLAESGALYGPGLVEFGIAPERLLTVAVGRRRDLLWTMEEALRCHAVSAVIGEMRGGAVDSVAMRRLSLAAAESGALALLLRAAPADDVSVAATRWIVGAAPSAPSPYGLGAPCFAAHLVRNRRGPLGAWIIEWSDSDERFILAAHAQPLAAPLVHRSHRQVASRVA